MRRLGFRGLLILILSSVFASGLAVVIGSMSGLRAVSGGVDGLGLDPGQVADLSTAIGGANRTVIIIAVFAMALVGGCTGWAFLAINRRVAGILARSLKVAEGDVEVDTAAPSGNDEFDQIEQAWHALVDYLRQAGDTATEVAAGRLDIEHVPRSEADLLGRALQSMIGTLDTTVGSVVALTDHVTDSTRDLAAMADESARTAEDVAGSIGDIADVATTQAEIATTLAAEMERIARDAAHLAGTSTLMASEAEEAITTGADGRSHAEEAALQIGAIRDSFDEISRMAQGLEQQSNQVEEIIDLIRSIADQTNLLALNAAIEAARAGTAGQGFAVVAAEVKALAEQSAHSTEQITAIVSRMRASVDETVSATRNGGEKVARGSEVITSASRSFGQVVDIVDRVRARIDDAARAATSIEASTAGVQSEVGRLSSITETSAAAAEQVAAASQEAAANSAQIGLTAGQLAEAATRLARDLAHFHTGR